MECGSYFYILALKYYVSEFHGLCKLCNYFAGRGTYGVLTSGCAETFESGQQQQFSREERSQRFRDDKHQKVDEFQKGDVIAIRAGDAHWVYNDGDQELVVVVFHHNSNYANQLDQNPRVCGYY